MVTVVIMTTGEDPAAPDDDEEVPRTELELPKASILADLLALDAGKRFDSDLVKDRSIFFNGSILNLIQL